MIGLVFSDALQTRHGALGRGVKSARIPRIGAWSRLMKQQKRGWGPGGIFHVVLEEQNVGYDTIIRITKSSIGTLQEVFAQLTIPWIHVLW